jgi:hypothetical protein
MQYPTTPVKKKVVRRCPSTPRKSYKFLQSRQSFLITTKEDIYERGINNLMHVYTQICMFINTYISIYKIKALNDIYSYYSLTKLNKSYGDIVNIPNRDINFKEILKFTKKQYGDPSKTMVSSSNFQKYCGMHNTIIELTDKVNLYNKYVDVIKQLVENYGIIAKKYPRIILPDNDNIRIEIAEYKKNRKLCYDHHLYRYPYPHKDRKLYPIDLT